MSFTIFNQLTAHQFTSQQIGQVSLSKSSTLFNEGDRLEHIYFVVQGTLNILKDKQLVWQAKSNEFIGISSFFNGGRLYDYEVKAEKKSKLYKISLADFQLALQSAPEFNLSLIQCFNHRINGTLSKITAQQQADC